MDSDWSNARIQFGNFSETDPRHAAKETQLATVTALWLNAKNSPFSAQYKTVRSIAIKRPNCL